MTRRARVSLAVLAASVLVSGAGIVELAARAEAPGAGPGAVRPEPLRGADLPREKSKAPTVEEWRAAGVARSVKLSRQGLTPCTAVRVREWLRVRCYRDEGDGSGEPFAISLLGGSNDGLSFWIGDEHGKPFSEVQLPLRSGDRRVVQLWSAVRDAAGTSVVTPSWVIQEHWVEGEPDPTVTLL